MARPCSVCNHPEVDQINRLILSGEMSFRKIAERFGISTTAVYRHGQEHIPIQATKASEAVEVAKADDLLSDIISLKTRGLSLLDQAEETGDLKTAVSALRAIREIITLLADINGRLTAQQTTVNILVNPEFVQIRTLIIKAVQDCPECRKRISEALK